MLKKRLVAETWVKEIAEEKEALIKRAESDSLAKGFSISHPKDSKWGKEIDADEMEAEADALAKEWGFEKEIDELRDWWKEM